MAAGDASAATGVRIPPVDRSIVGHFEGTSSLGLDREGVTFRPFATVEGLDGLNPAFVGPDDRFRTGMSLLASRRSLDGFAPSAARDEVT